MPTYGYICQQCKHEFDAFQKITDEALVKCPQCGKDSLQRGVGGGSASFNFKGEGFYANDYKDSKGGPSDAPSANSCCPCGKKDGGSCKSS